MLLRRNSAPDNISKEELHLRVAERIARVSPDMSIEDIDEIAMRALKRCKKIQEVPRYSQVINMTHRELNLVLQECPESPYFARDDFQTSENFA